MSTVATFSQVLLKLDPQKSQARQALFHFSKFLCDKDQAVHLGFFERFMAFALNESYWRTHFDSLMAQLIEDVGVFEAKFEVPFTMAEIESLNEIQVLQISSWENLKDLVRGTLGFLGGQVLQSHLLKLDDQRVLALTRETQDCLKIRVFGCHVIIRHGQLQLISPKTNLTYNSRNELAHGVHQYLEGQLSTVSRFLVTDLGCQGQILRGHTWQKYEVLNGMSVSQVPEIQHALKKIERHFIRPESDPDYQELIAKLEQAYEWASHADVNSRRKSIEQVLQRGKSALRNVFPKDKLLLLLVTNIEYLLSRSTPAPGPSV